MQLKINKQPLYTLEILDVLERNTSAFGKEYFNPDAFLKEREKLLAGTLTRRCPEDVICYEIILDGGKHVGDITLTPVTPNELELDIIIFLTGSGYGSTALIEFVNHYKETYKEDLSAMVLTDNPISDKVVKMFIQAGFIKKANYENGVYLQLKKE
ncbi:hypothetical protein V7597_16150 [Bacillus toyonensis]|uniref:hypothetical protein n=1 Tax=Bacillus toyonensis TaxID=155322 RepID=UPI002FFEC342